MNKFLLSICYLLTATFVSAKDIPSKPNPPKLVNDYASVLSQNEVQILEQKLSTYYDSTSTQISIVIEKSLDGDDLVDYCQRIGEGWGIGEKGKSNGILIYVAIDDHKMRIHTGYGMEATVTDLLSRRIEDEYMKPAFREQNYFAGLDAATDIIIRAAAGEFINDTPAKNRKRKGVSSISLIVFIIIAIVLSFFNRGGRRGGGFLGYAPFIGTFGGSGFSGGGGGGFGGGGFSGFGGGGFGGGGSSGSW